MESKRKDNIMYLAIGNIKPECFSCNGTCWVNPTGNLANKRKANFKTQANAKKMFGFIPNACVIDCDGHARCPYANGLLGKL